MRWPFVRRPRYEAVLEDAQSCAIALAAIRDRVGRVAGQGSEDAALLTEIDNILNIVFAND